MAAMDGGDGKQDEVKEAGEATPKEAKRRIDRIETLRLLILALFGTLAGFAVIYVLVSPGAGRPVPPRAQPEPPPSAAQAMVPPATVPAVREASGPATSEPLSLPAATPEPQAAAGSPSPDSPPPSNESPDAGHVIQVPVATQAPSLPTGPTPPGLALADEPPFYFRCWDQSGKQKKPEECDPLRVFEKRLASRLYVVHRCKESSVGPEPQGRFSLGVDVDFKDKKLNFWSGSSTEIENGTRIAACLRRDFAGIPLDGISHQYERYTVFFTLIFGKEGGKPAKVKAKAPSDSPDIKPGKTALVKWSRANLRASPDGSAEVKTKLEKGAKVRVMQIKEDWVRVKGPAGEEGWISIDGLE